MQQSLLAQTSADKKLGDDLPLYKLMLKAFTTVEIFRWSQFEQQYAAELAARDDIFGGDAGAKRKVWRWRLAGAGAERLAMRACCGGCANASGH